MDSVEQMAYTREQGTGWYEAKAGETMARTNLD